MAQEAFMTIWLYVCQQRPVARWRVPPSCTTELCSGQGGQWRAQKRSFL